MDYQELIERMRGFEIDHEPNGWPAIQMRDISAMCDAIESLLSALDVADSEVKRTVAERDAPKYGCHCDLEDHMEPDGCVIDIGNLNDCVYAKRHKSKEQCQYWRPIRIVKPDENK